MRSCRPPCEPAYLTLSKSASAFILVSSSWGRLVEEQTGELLALGETPNIAARIQGQAEPDTVVISEATHRLVEGLFECEDSGRPELKGISTPLTLYRVVKEGEAQSRFEVAVHKGLTPLVGRAEELVLLQRRWEQRQNGCRPGRAGEWGAGDWQIPVGAGVQRAAWRARARPASSFAAPPITRTARCIRSSSTCSGSCSLSGKMLPQAKLEKLQHTLSHYRFPQADTVPLLAALLSLPHPEGYPPLTVSPQKQKEKTQEALVAWIVEEAEKAAVYCAWEDLHWADPSTLEVLTLFLDQVPTTRLLALLTFRPEFSPPWGNRSHFSQMTLSRLGRPHVETMVEQVTQREGAAG